MVKEKQSIDPMIAQQDQQKEEASALVVISSQGEIATADKVYKRLIAILPPKIFSSGEEDDIRRQTTEISNYVHGFHSGELTVPTPSDFLTKSHVSEQYRRELAVKRLRGIIAFTVLDGKEGVHAGRAKEKGLQNKVARQTNDTILFLGDNGYEQFISALGTLNDVERALLFDVMSTNLKSQLYYPDVEECSEEQMGTYLHDAVRVTEGGLSTVFPAPELLERVSYLIDASYQRSGERFRIQEVVTRLLTLPRAGESINRIIQAGYFTEQLDIAEEMLLQHPETHRFALLCRQYLNGERRMEIPEWMKDYDQTTYRNQE